MPVKLAFFSRAGRYICSSLISQDTSHRPSSGNFVKKAFIYFVTIMFLLGSIGMPIAFVPSEIISKYSHIYIIMAIILGTSLHIILRKKYDKKYLFSLKNRSFKGFFTEFFIITIFSLVPYLAISKTIPLTITVILGNEGKKQYLIVEKDKDFSTTTARTPKYIYGGWHKCHYKVWISTELIPEKTFDRGNRICTIGKEAWEKSEIGDRIVITGTSSWAGMFIDSVTISKNSRYS